MKKPVLLALFLSTSYLPLRAQEGAAAAPAPAPVPTIAAAVSPSTGHQDTLRAIDNMFERRRNGGKKWLYVAGAGTLAFLRAATATPTSPNPYVKPSGPDPAGLALIFGIFTGIPGAIGIGKLVRFSETKQQVIEESYRNGKALPRSVSSRLKAKDF